MRFWTKTAGSAEIHQNGAFRAPRLVSPCPYPIVRNLRFIFRTLPQPAPSKLLANYFAFSTCESLRRFLASKVKVDLRGW